MNSYAYEIDLSKGKFMLTFNPRGVLKRGA